MSKTTPHGPLDGAIGLKRYNGTDFTITFPYGDDQHER